MADGYTVTDVNQRERFTPGGSKVSYFDIHITTARGASGMVRINAVDYVREKVKPLLDEKAAELDMAFDF